MMQELPQTIRSKSQISYSYMTIKMTPSRINKGLIAIPVALTKWFPKQNGVVHVYFGDSHDSQPRTFSSYDSTTRECRLGGMADWFRGNGIKSGDEIVIQVIDKKNFIYRLVPEKEFIVKTQELQHRFDNSESEREASGEVVALVDWIHLDKQEVVLSEFKRLIDTMPMQDRRFASSRSTRARERAPANLRTLLEDIYKGRCQVCDFWFLKRDNKPYFETHHLNPLHGHHPKNVIVVCGNCHNQFEHANVYQDFNVDGWLTRVIFNKRAYSVYQTALSRRLEDSFKDIFVI